MHLSAARVVSDWETNLERCVWPAIVANFGCAVDNMGRQLQREQSRAFLRAHESVRSTAVNRPGFHTGMRRKPPREEEALGMAVCGAQGGVARAASPALIPTLGVTV